MKRKGGITVNVTRRVRKLRSNGSDVFQNITVPLFFYREKKKDKERDELWKKLENLALNHNHKGKK